MTSLTEELEAYLFKQFQVGHKLKGWTCPGEHACATEEGERIYEKRRREPDLPVLSVCYPQGQESDKRCPAFESKPEARPPHLADAISTAYRLTGSARAVYQWPDSLSPIQWACLRAFERAEAKWKIRVERTKEQQTQSNDHMRHLARLAHS